MNLISPINIIAVSLGVAFFMGMLGKKLQGFSYFLMLAALLFNTIISLEWFYALANNLAEAQQVFTAGFKPPLSINLLMGLNESVITGLVNVAGLLGAVYMASTLKKVGTASQVVFLVLIMSLNVIVLSRDLFNIFVFLEVASIAVAGLIILQKGLNAVSAGFKYMIATGLISSFLLLGIIFIYRFSGTLNLDMVIESNPMIKQGAMVSTFIIMVAILLELKPFPANGWALDVYQAAHPGLSAMLSSAVATANLYVLYKFSGLNTESSMYFVGLIGLITFVGSNLLGMNQTNARRLLGYSSVGQIGLLVAIIGFIPHSNENFKLIFIGLLTSHYFAKAGLFWIAGIVKTEKLKEWSVLRNKPILLFLFLSFVLALTGFPPFPSFWGKWQLIMELSQQGNMAAIIAILVGSFFEVVYLLRWAGYSIKLEAVALPKVKLTQLVPVILFGLGIYATGYFVSQNTAFGNTINYFPLLVVAALLVLDFLPAFVKNSLSILATGWFAYELIPGQETLKLVFTVIFLIGGILTLIPGFHVKGKRAGFYPSAMLMFGGLALLIEAENLLQFFFAWEIMTLGSYFLIIRGKKSMPHAFSYMLFSVGGAYLILMAFGMVSVGNSGLSLSLLSQINFYPVVALALLAIGFMTKTASLGLHIWLPGAHGEAESDVSPMVSAILLKAGVFGLVMLMLASGGEHNSYSGLFYTLGWIGALTALVGNLGAIFQEDAKRLLAYSSIGQLGYILFAFSIMSQMGWLTGFTYTINHFMFKAILFLSVGGVVMRLGTHNMYEMGGLIKKMPFSFIAVLIGIITLAGIPPLSGFAGKWLFYNAVILKGWYFQGAIVFFAGTIAFLYCFKLIYSIFLGQLKDNHRNVKELPFWYLLPIYILIFAIMVFSAKPDLILKPLGNVLAVNFPSNNLTWNGTTAMSKLGYWDATTIMIVIGTMFVILFSWLWLMSRKAQKVKQFNMVYAGERPERPELTHVSHNIYAGYNKALGFLVAPGITHFWKYTCNLFESTGNFIRRLYSGNGQSYAFHLVTYIVIVFVIYLSSI
ncbi:proton-conducting transporter membrane subunit [uncultured Draconibacterium sp.]|uniref:proton-conducting transporter transmembrane domain-containing protein n=1 Tax=uncultured Draconibacterium sp. TaxID=1573823 RepID=UPI003217BF4B